MELKHFWCAAAVFWGCTALGDHHGGGGGSGGWADCSSCANVNCYGECADLNACYLEGGDMVECSAERAAFETCCGSPPPVIIIPPSSCPPGQHFNAQGQCQADHECHHDEIGGGSEECEECGPGEVPNEDGTACEECEHGEAAPGLCGHDPCGRDGTDFAAGDALWINYPNKEPTERATFLYCKNGIPEETAWKTAPDSNRCSITVTYMQPYQKSCWRGGSKESGCNLSLVHTHPWFTWPDDNGAMCNGENINTALRADKWNAGGMEFSTDDVNAANAFFVEGHLGVSDRSCARALRRTGWKESIGGSCTPKHRLPKYAD